MKPRNLLFGGGLRGRRRSGGRAYPIRFIESAKLVCITLTRLVRSLRPAPVGSAIAHLLRLTRRRPVETAEGTFSLSPCSLLGTALLTGGYEPAMVQVLHKHLFPGATFIDLGAQEGYFTVIASKLVGSAGCVIAVEPQSRLQAVIQENLYLNACCNVRVLRTLITGTSGDFPLSLTTELDTGSSSIWNPGALPKRTEVVRGLSLGDFVSRAGLGKCDLMKVDIEGAEHEVFMNAGEVLRQGILRKIVMEIHNPVLERRGLSGQELHRFILDCGYSLDNSLGPWTYLSKICARRVNQEARSRAREPK